MADYNLHGLNTREFQHLVQAIARKQITPAIAAFGDGKDGGRDLSYDGPMNFPSISAPWNGYVIVGCKFLQKPTRDSLRDAAWALDQLERDLKKFTNKRRKLRPPDYYLFTTNVALTAADKTGSRDRVTEMLSTYARRLGMKGHCVWDYHDLRGFLDGDLDIRSAYGHFITAGDILVAVARQISTLSADFVTIMHSFLQKELLADRAAKLQSAGEDPDLQIPLANVFVDLPFAETAEAAALTDGAENKLRYVVDTILEAGTHVLRRTGSEDSESEMLSAAKAVTDHSKFSIVGGPGQGKSTFGQYLCQIYRAAILQDRPKHLLDDRVPGLIKQLEEKSASGSLPAARRFPIRIELRDFAQAISNDRNLTLFEHIRRDIVRLANAKIDERDLKSWLANYPWILILDGLDEVPPSSNRAELIAEIDSFQIDARSNNADLLIIATTRPQGYSKEFSEQTFKHLYLAPLTANQALLYANKLVQIRCRENVRRADDLLKSLEKACQNPATSRLMQSPLQVTIMATLIEDTGEPPQQRYRLFAEYYRTIYRRETRRKLLDGILTERQKDIDTIHAQVGLLLHAASEVTSSTIPSQHRRDVDSSLSDEQFRELVKRRLDCIQVSPGKAEDLLNRISDGSLQRLVFLVRQTEGWVRFDVASFKEFMAAEAIMTGSDEDLRARMKAIAPASYWRNAFQFAVGKCFSERDHLLHTVVTLCVSLNDARSANDVLHDRVSSDAAQAVLWGSLLALDILSDGTARQVPAFESMFVQIALELVKLGNANACARLATIYHDDLRVPFEKAIRIQLTIKSEYSWIGALQLLIALADHGVQWANTLLSGSWPSDPNVVLRATLTQARTSYSETAVRKICEIAPTIAPFWIMHNFDISPRIKKSKWLSSGLRALLQASSRDAMRKTHTQVNNLSTWRDFVPGFTVNYICPSSELWKSLNGVDFQNALWFPVVASARFRADPSAANLSKELRWLAETWNGEPVWMWDGLSPWPLAECVARSRSSDDLIKFAEAAESGALGDLTDWTAAEIRWKEQGLMDGDFAIPLTSCYSFKDAGGSVVFPFCSSGSRVKDMVSAESFSACGSKLSKVHNLNARALLAETLFNVWQYAGQWKGVEISSLQVLNLYRCAMMVPRFARDVRLETLQAHIANTLDPTWIELLDVIGGNASWIIDHGSPELLENLVNHFNVDPQKHRGLLRVIAGLVSDNTPVRILPSILEEATAWGERFRGTAVGLMLAREELRDHVLDDIASRLLACEAPSDVVMSALKFAGAVSSLQKARFALTLLRRCEGTDALGIDVAMTARSVLEEFLTRRPSDLQTRQTWDKLNLPARL